MATAPIFTDDDFLAGFLNLFPTGPIWPRDPATDIEVTWGAGPIETQGGGVILAEDGQAISTEDTESITVGPPVFVQTCRALIKGYTRNAASAAGLLADAFPVQPVMLLPEWEETLGLPDPCAGESPTIQQRQQQVNARFIGAGGQSVAYFVSVAAALGYTITITQFSAYRVGDTVGLPLNGQAWAFAWQVNAPQFTVDYFRTGVDAVGEPLASWGNTVLQCELQRLAPAHTTIIFNYSS